MPSRTRSSLVKQTEAHVVVLRLLGLLNLGRSGGLRSGGHWGGGHGELAGVGQVLLDLLSLLEGDVGLGGDGQQVLEAVDDAVRHGGGGGHADRERHGRHVAHALHERSDQVVVGQVEHLRVEDGAGIVHLLHDQTVRERRDTQHVQQGSLRTAHLVTFVDQVHVILKTNITNVSFRERPAQFNYKTIE